MTRPAPSAVGARTNVSLSTANDGTDEFGVLAAVGLSELEERIYRDLVRWNGGTASDVAARAQVSASRARDTILSLERKGLVGRSSRPVGHYVATPPETALEILVLRRSEELERVRLLARELKPEAAGGPPSSGADEAVELIEGGEAITSRHYQLMLSARKEIVGFAVAPIEPITDEFINFKLRVLGRGIRARHVCSREVLRTPGFVDFVQAVGRVGEETRTATELPMPMLVVDRRSALVPLPSDRRGGYHQYLALKGCALVDALVTLFEKVWEDALPFEPGQAGSGSVERASFLTDDDRRLLSLLAAGLKDSAIGPLLGLGHRTVERRVRRIMDLLGTQSRFQTGVEAARRGWLEATPVSGGNGHTANGVGPQRLRRSS